MNAEVFNQALELLEYKAHMNRIQWEAVRKAYEDFLEPLDDELGLSAVQACCEDMEKMPQILHIRDKFFELRREKQASSDSYQGPRGYGGFASAVKITGPQMWEQVRKGILEYYTETRTKPCREMREFVRQKDAKYRQVDSPA
jgi:hypothetical protein